MPEAEAIAARKLSKVYRGGHGAFELEFTVHEGEIFGFLGPNGAGKTTTIRTLMGLLRPTGGSATVFGLDCWRESTAVKDKVGFVSADPRLYEKMTGAAFLDFMAGYRARGTMDRARAMAAEMDLDLRPTIRQLSRGNRQKLLLVQGFMHDPPLLILDEASGGLDPLGQEMFLRRLLGERSRGKTVFLSSHNLAEVEGVADRVGIIRDGRMVAIEEIDKLRSIRTRRMDVTLAAPVDDGFLDRLEGVRVVETTDGGKQIQLAVQGSPRELLARLGTLPVVDLVFPPADLESVFMQYYRDEGEPRS
ncbi:MAG TPA: ABC transporter ATP-binding protein [Candidatus Dormibacteraeota bacterium]|nr:ABC transporter ATP-binding protein [Candidatus Dormibacteraeota bacterium]